MVVQRLGYELVHVLALELFVRSEKPVFVDGLHNNKTVKINIVLLQNSISNKHYRHRRRPCRNCIDLVPCRAWFVCIQSCSDQTLWNSLCFSGEKTRQPCRTRNFAEIKIGETRPRNRNPIWPCVLWHTTAASLDWYYNAWASNRNWSESWALTMLPRCRRPSHPDLAVHCSTCCHDSFRISLAMAMAWGIS